MQIIIKIDFSYNDNWCTVCYGDLIIGILVPMGIRWMV